VECRNYARHIQKANMILLNRFQFVSNSATEKFDSPPEYHSFNSSYPQQQEEEEELTTTIIPPESFANSSFSTSNISVPQNCENSIS